MSESAAHEKQEPDGPALQLIRESLHGLQFGVVTLIVQDGVVVQVERTEKHRIRRTPPPGT